MASKHLAPPVRKYKISFYLIKRKDKFRFIRKHKPLPTIFKKLVTTNWEKLGVDATYVELVSCYVRNYGWLGFLLRLNNLRLQIDNGEIYDFSQQMYDSFVLIRKELQK